MSHGLLTFNAVLFPVIFLISSCEEGAKPTPALPPAQPPATTPVAPVAAPPAAKTETKTEPKAEVKAVAAPAATPQPEEKKAQPPVSTAQPAPITPPAAASTASSPAPTAPATPAAGPNPALLNPALATEKAPDKYKARFTTTKGDFVIEVTREWAPNGADRFYNLVKTGFFTDAAFFRNIAGFMVQFGINGDPAVSTKWRDARIPDDPVKQSNKSGYVSFATSGPNTRTTQLFINHGNNNNLDGMGFSPFGQVVEGLNVVGALHNGYGEGAPRGRGPRQDLIQSQGNAYLKKDFPNLDYVKTAAIVK